MAKVQGPLMSMQASGTVAGIATFSVWKGRPYVRARVTPHNPRTDAQTGVRANMAGLVQLYQGNKAALDSAFADRAKQQSISTFNAFTGFNQKRRSQNLQAANSLTPTDAAPADNATGAATDVAGKYAKLTWTDSVSADAWGVIVYRKLAADPTGLNNEQVALVRQGLQSWQDGPLVAGTWHYVIAAISENGGEHAVSVAVTAVIV